MIILLWEVCDVSLQHKNLLGSHVPYLQELTIPLKVYVTKFPECQQLHPYEQSLLELTLGPGVYEEVTCTLNLNLR